MTARVTLVAGEDASGLACMLAALLEDNLRDFRARRFVASHTRGDVVLRASDRDLAVTLSFRRGEIRIAEGQVPDAPVLAGDWLELTRLCSGRRSPVAAVAARELHVTPGRGMRAAAGAGFALSVPRSFYEEDRDAVARRRLATVALLVLAPAVVAALVRVYVMVRQEKQ